MSSITGSCETPANELFKQGLQKVEDSQTLKADQEEKTAALNIEKSNADLSTASASSTNAQLSNNSQSSANSPPFQTPQSLAASQQNNNSPEINKGLLINISV